MMKFFTWAAAFFSCMLLNAYAAGGYSLDLDLDLDLDGKQDHIEINVPEFRDMNSVLPLKLHITFASSKNVVDQTIPVIGYYLIYFYPGVWRDHFLKLNFTNTVSRDAAEFFYEIYKWNDDLKRLCRYIKASGIPRNQLARETHASMKNVEIYMDCNPIDDLPSQTIDEPDPNFWASSNVHTKVVVDKAYLFNAPGPMSKSKMYLIRGDSVSIKDHRYVKGKDWYRAEYISLSNRPPIVKWIEGRSIGLDLPE
jgi:hypothetical protein